MGKFTQGTIALIILVTFLLCGCARHERSEMPLAPGEVVNLMEEPSTIGNCLSMPVIFAEGYGLTGVETSVGTGLRGTPGVELFTTPYDDVTFIDGFPVYRNPSINEWQADWATGADYGGVVPVQIDWADNLTRNTWTERSKVRVEVVLTATIEPAVLPLEGYSMFSLGGTMLDEVFVTNTVKYTATAATVYTPVARLTIVKLDAQGGVPTHTLYDGVCYEGYFVDGPTGAYSAEVNMSGKVIFGFLWDVGASDLTDKTGWYRLTFSLDPMANYTDLSGNPYSYPRNTIITSLDPGDVLGSEPEIVVYPPTLADDGYSSSVDTYIRARSGGGGGGGGNGGKPGDKSGDKGGMN